MCYKEIICLANSYKNEGRCIAGKDVKDHKWVRPISARPDGKLCAKDYIYSNDEVPQLLDIIKIPFASAKPTICQPENILIGKGKWQKIGTFPKSNISELCDAPGTIWFNSGGKNDRVPVGDFQKDRVKGSLYLIKPELIKVIRDKKARAFFKYKSIEYNLVITDPAVKAEFKKRVPGTYDLPVKELYLCLSLAEAFQGFCYKLVAAII